MIEIYLKDSRETIESTLKEIKKKNETAILCISCYANPKHLLDWRALFRVKDGFFWRTPDHSFEMIGLSPIATFECGMKSDRFEVLKDKWSEQMRHTESLVEEQTNLSFPITFGAFSFDEKKEHSEGWAELPENVLMIPEFLCINRAQQLEYVMQIQVTQATSFVDIEAKTKDYARLLEATQANQQATSNKRTMKQIMPFHTWHALVEKAKHEIAKGTFSKVVLARETKLSFEHEVDIATMLKQLYEVQKENYIFLLRQKGITFIGATPERLVLAENRYVRSACIAGTERRGKNEAEDNLLGQQLLKDDKNLREHYFVVDKVEEAMAQICTSYTLKEKPMLLKNKFVQHLFTPVYGQLKPGVHLLSVVEKMHPTPALGGVPKSKALQFLREEENLNRGWYGAPIGWMDKKENGEFIVGIRSGLVNGKDLTLFSGCGVVGDSDAKSEYEETDLKLRPMLESLGDAIKHEKS